MKWLNLAGGVKLLWALPEIKIMHILEEGIEKAS